MTGSDMALTGLVGIIRELSLERLAVAAKHEHEDVLEVVVPPEDSLGAQVLRNGRDAFIAWVMAEHRWPSWQEAENDAATVWHHGLRPSEQAQAYVDLGLFFSPWAAGVPDATGASLLALLDLVAERLAVTLADEYGPLV